MTLQPDLVVLVLAIVGLLLMVGVKRLAQQLALLALILVLVTAGTPYVLRWFNDRWSTLVADAPPPANASPTYAAPSGASRATEAPPTTSSPSFTPPASPATPSALGWIPLVGGYLALLALWIRRLLGKRLEDAGHARERDRVRDRERERVAPPSTSELP